MKLNTLEAHNLRGLSFTHALRDVTVFTGDNRAGKSTRLHSAALVLVGHLPQMGTQVSATFSMAGTGNQMSVGSDTTLGRVFRTWTRSKDRVKLDNELPKDFPELPAVLLDATEYFELSPEKRTQYVFDRIRLADVPALSPQDLTAQLKNIKAKEHTAAHQTALDTIVSAIMDSARERHQAVQSGDSMPLQDWLETEITALEERIANAKSSADRMAKKQAADAELQTSNPTTAPLNTDEQELAIEELRKEIAALQSERGQVIEAKRQADASRQKVEAARKALDSFAGKIAERQTMAESWDALQAKVNAYTSKTQTLMGDETATLLDIQKAEQELTRINGELEVVNKAITDAVANALKRDALEKELHNYPDQTDAIAAHEASTVASHRATQGYTSRTGEIKAKTDAQILHRDELEAFITLLGKKCCPTCKREFDDAKSISILESKRAALATVVSDIDFLRTEFEQSQAADRENLSRLTSNSIIEVALAQSRTAQRKRAEIQTQLDKLPASVDMTQKQTELGLALSAARSAVAPMRARLAEIQQSLKLSRSEDATIAALRDKVLPEGAKNLTALDAELARKPEYEAVIAEQPTAADHNTEILRIDNLALAKEQQIAQLNTTVQASIAAKAEEMRRREAVDELIKAKAEQEIGKLCLEAVKGFRDQLVAHAFGGILKLANSVAGAVLGIEIQYRENEIGYWKDAKWIGFDNFSESEHALTFAMISIALAIDSPCKIVIFDELARLTAGNLSKFLHCMKDLVRRGVITQFIGAMPTSDFAFPEGVQHISI